jgi:hypothetical protein
MRQIFLLFFLVPLLALAVQAQEFDDESNWYKEIGRGDDYYTRFDFKRYSPEDIRNAKRKYLEIVAERSQDEWAGSYTRQTMLGRAEIIWSKHSGFVYHYVYHTLASIDYGRVATSDDSIFLVSERNRPPAKWNLETELIRVKLGERRLLVPKDRLRDFALFAAGLEVATGRREKEVYSEDGFFWENVEDENKNIADVPTYPSRYAHLTRKPITLRIISSGRKQIKREKSEDWGTTSEEHWRNLTLSKGATSGVEVGMTFWIDAIEEWVEIISLRPNRSVARLSRSFFDGKEYCSKFENHSQIEFPCREPKIGMNARTKSDYF